MLEKLRMRLAKALIELGLRLVLGYVPEGWEVRSKPTERQQDAEDALRAALEGQQLVAMPCPCEECQIRRQHRAAGVNARAIDGCN